LHYCLAFGHDALGDYLLAKGADASVANKHGLTPFDGLVPE
jgi:ankyrin repeat protein|tara:strand:- start:868 stop:990 length:123 start_codon:yes stop_codon:yes gene_type:complete